MAGPDLPHIIDRIKQSGHPVDWQALVTAEEMLGAHGSMGPRRQVVEFIAQYASLREAKRILDPHVVSPSLLAAAADRKGVERSLGLVQSPAAAGLSQDLATPDIEWRAGDPLSSVSAVVESFDLIVSAPPFGQRAPDGTRATEYAILARVAPLLSPGGEIVFLLPEGFNSEHKAQRVRDQLARSGLSVLSIVAVPDAIYATGIRAQLAFFSKGEKDTCKLAVLSVHSHADTHAGNGTARDSPGLFWLPNRAEKYFKERFSEALPLLSSIRQLPSP